MILCEAAFDLIELFFKSTCRHELIGFIESIFIELILMNCNKNRRSTT